MEHALWTQRPSFKALIYFNHLLFFCLFCFAFSRNCNINIEQYCFEFHWNWIEFDLISQSLKLSVFVTLLWVVLSNLLCHTVTRNVSKKCQPSANKPHKKWNKRTVNKRMLKWKTRFSFWIFEKQSFWIEKMWPKTQLQVEWIDDDFVWWNGRASG